MRAKPLFKTFINRRGRRETDSEPIYEIEETSPRYSASSAVKIVTDWRPKVALHVAFTNLMDGNVN